MRRLKWQDSKASVREGIWEGTAINKSQLTCNKSNLILKKIVKIYTYMEEINMEPPNNGEDNAQTKYLSKPIFISSEGKGLKWYPGNHMGQKMLQKSYCTTDVTQKFIGGGGARKSSSYWG